MGPETRLAGITSGGAWLVERLHKDLNLPGNPSVLSSALHRDDFAQRGMATSAQTQIDFDVNGADILVLDDVLYTRSEEHTSELQSQSNLVCRLLLEKKKKNKQNVSSHCEHLMRTRATPA